MDRLVSERWKVGFENWEMGLFIQLIWQWEYDSTIDMPMDSQFCLEFALFSEELDLKIERET